MNDRSTMMPRHVNINNILIYKNVTIEIQRVWNLKTNVIPVISGPTKTISKSFRKYLNNTKGKH
jgi:hypothetical protein